MPVHTIDAPISWTFDQDLAIVSAGRYTVEYARASDNHEWLPDYWNAIAPYRGEADPDLVTIRATADAFADVVVEGVVDRSGRERTDEGVVGRLEGRDRFALLLDRFPAAPYAISGLAPTGDKVQSVANKTVTKTLAAGYTESLTTFRAAVRDLCERAGLSVVFSMGSDDYRIGKPVAVTRETAWAALLANLLVPWRWAERRKVDAWIEGTTLRVARRDLRARGTVTVDASRLTVDRMTRSRLPAVNDVRVEGATLKVWGLKLPWQPKADQSGVELASAPQPGQSWDGAYQHSFGPETLAAGGYSRTISGTIYYDERGNPTRTIIQEAITAPAGATTTTVEASTLEYETDAALASFGKVLRSTITHTVDGGLASETEEAFRYFEDTGDVELKITTTRQYDVAGAPPFPLKQTQIITDHYVRTAAGLLHGTSNMVYDAGGSRQDRLEWHGVTPFTVDPTARVIKLLGLTPLDVQISAGGEDAQRRESSELLGDQPSVDRLRGYLLEDHAATKVEADLRLAPDLRIRPGVWIHVDGAPADWPLADLCVTSVRLSSRDPEFGLEISCEGWIADA